MSVYIKLEKLSQLVESIKYDIIQRVEELDSFEDETRNRIYLKSTGDDYRIVISDSMLLKQTVIWLPNYITINRISEILKGVDKKLLKI